ncbi:TonB-dependent receptor [Pedobacter yulinensis]|uniref:TonB-dependent receptor n=1 Tax=Pedobacter yulinensis TaxID=2126353 RepID=A0A2T3HIX0_9SPHI|nr:TonB-dependent receptor [Pedobacter yulinensis]PST82380.1 TonB-dependent receptor [Pedobacter yulinensis]
MKLFCLVIAGMLASVHVSAQQDSSVRLDDVSIRSGLNKRPALKSATAAGILNPAQLRNHTTASPVSAMNSLSGVRMEERSPGSYRLSLRGSLLRSPFGIRNTKIYLDVFPLTDAGGNTYLNLIDMSAIDRVEVLKGPQSDLYGANSGGVIVIDPSIGDKTPPFASVSLSGGSFGLRRESARLDLQGEHAGIQIKQAWHQSDGYRNNSAMNRKYLQLAPWIHAGDHDRIRALVIYSDLGYQTPGGLTLGQYQANASAARPAAGPNPGAEEQQAAIYNRTFFGGLSNEADLGKKLKHVAAVFASASDFENPFITNYEQRKEQTFGFRTYFEFAEKLENTRLNLHLGAEHLVTGSTVKNYQNQRGTAAAPMADDALRATQSFLFAHLRTEFGERLQAELGISLNRYGYQYQSFFPQQTAENERRFDPKLMPRLALSYLLAPGLALRASAARGYSTPTISEVRASDNQINTALDAESGNNYEAGLRYEHPGRWWSLNIAAFDYRLNRAIVRRLTPNDLEYFINAGGTRQQGLELQGNLWLIRPAEKQLIRGLEWRIATTYSDFRFAGYRNADTDYSGNRLTGVPKWVAVNSLHVLLPLRLDLFVQHNFTDAIPLDDANLDYSRRYHLLEARISCAAIRLGPGKINFFAGADNLLNQRYSLGNDLNAFGKRYYNAAAPRNYYAGLSMEIR